MKKVTRPQDLVERVKSELFDAILTGKLQPGEKLQQDMLAEKLGVSRQPVSHALRILSEQGILTGLDNRSLTVAELDPDKMLQIYDVRIELETYAAGLAADRHHEFSDEDRHMLEQMQMLVSRNRGNGAFNVKQSVRDDIQFHRLVRKISGNLYVDEILAPHLLHHNRIMYVIQPHNDPQIWREHQAILNAIEACDASNARKLVREHLNGGVAYLKAYWKSQHQSKKAAATK